MGRLLWISRCWPIAVDRSLLAGCCGCGSVASYVLVAVGPSLWVACFVSIVASIGHSVSHVVVGLSLCWSVL